MTNLSEISYSEFDDSELDNAMKKIMEERKTRKAKEHEDFIAKLNRYDSTELITIIKKLDNFSILDYLKLFEKEKLEEMFNKLNISIPSSSESKTKGVSKNNFGYIKYNFEGQDYWIIRYCEFDAKDKSKMRIAQTSNANWLNDKTSSDYEVENLIKNKKITLEELAKIKYKKDDKPATKELYGIKNFDGKPVDPNIFKVEEANKEAVVEEANKEAVVEEQLNQ